MNNQTTSTQRRAFYEHHRRGMTYQEIGQAYKVSKECVRYWCRRQRDGGSCKTVYRRKNKRVLNTFEPIVRYCVLRLRLEHPCWGPDTIRFHLTRRPSLRNKRLPSPASIGRYLHQWPRFHRRQSRPEPRPRLNQATDVHQRWQLDFKVHIELDDGTLIHLHNAYDPVGSVCIGSSVFMAGKKGDRRRVQMENVRGFLRTCFARWQTLPREVQTDGETVLTGKPVENAFPSIFTLWLKGLGIDHLVTRPGKPTDNAHVERCHRTINEYVIIGNEHVSPTQLQTLLEQAVDDLAFHRPSRAHGCGGRPPTVAYPELLQPTRAFQPEQELASFDLKKVDEFLASLSWPRKVGSDGRVRLGKERYFVGCKYRHRQLVVRFDPDDRSFFFSLADEPNDELKRLPAKGLTETSLLGIDEWPFGQGIQQLPLPLVIAEG